MYLYKVKCLKKAKKKTFNLQVLIDCFQIKDGSFFNSKTGKWWHLIKLFLQENIA